MRSKRHAHPVPRRGLGNPSTGSYAHEFQHEVSFYAWSFRSHAPSSTTLVTMTDRNVPVRHAVVPAAGRGTRFLPITKSVPKEMLPVVDRPSIEYIAREATDAGIDDMLFVTRSLL